MKTFGLKLSMVAHMMAMQDSMNTMIIGRDWVDAENHPNVDFVAAMSAEAGEFPDHMGFKWWKKQEPDVAQAKLELVDIYHFMISHIAQITFSTLKRNNRGEIPRFSMQELKTMALDKASSLVSVGAAAMLENSKCGAYVEEFLSIDCKATRRKKLCRVVRRTVEMFEFDNISQEMNKPRHSRTLEDVIVNAVDNFLVACAMIGMSGKELYLNYVGKNVLNRFRQDHGYKDGSYVKIWNGLEDNQVLENFIKVQTKVDNLDDTVDYEAAVYNHLSRHYPVKKTEEAKTA